MSTDTSVRVAVRIRPQISREIIEMCQVCTSVTPGEPQVWLGKDKAFTFDHVYDIDSTQEAVYETCVKQLVQGCFEGYNATVLAYGQTGSGKTYTMGTGFEPNSQFENSDSSRGIVPRAVYHIFNEIHRRRAESIENNCQPPEFEVKAQFLELYNEDIIDLLDNESHQIKIVQENGNIFISGATNRPINSVPEAFECLKAGALSRTTASTKMNSQSSRSHAIFTLSIQQNYVTHVKDFLSDDEETNNHSVDKLYAKFHFVDLAGSERLKRTGATGERAKEGISINTGLLCLGNVISALGDKSKKSTHVPYRDSKLTRLLQDSLGGNSQTLMIACISPSDSDFMETLSTLSYANRAKNIKNKIVANHDSTGNLIATLRKEIQALQLEILDLKQGKRLIADDGTEYINDMYHENSMLLNENQSLKNRVKALQESNEKLVARNAEIIADRECANFPDVKDIVQRYLKEIEGLKLKLLEMEEASCQQRKQTARLSIKSDLYDPDISSEKVIRDAKREVKKLKSLTKHINNGLSANESDIISHSPHDSCESNATDGDVEGDDEDDNDVVDDDENDSSEDNSEENEIRKAKQELVQLTDDISTKELLIASLEKSQRKMQSLKHHYESKLTQLRNQITEIVIERDQVLAKLSQAGNKTEEKARKMDYDKKITNLQNDLKKLQEAKREHANAMRNQAKYEQQLRKLRNEVHDMKVQKVNIMTKMKEEASRHRASELQSNKKIAQLTKQERLKDVKIKHLETDNNRMKQTLKRKEAEVRALKNKNKADKMCKLRQSPKFSKMKWFKLERKINELIALRRTIWSYEQQISRDCELRQDLSERLEEADMRLREYEAQDDMEMIKEYGEIISNINTNIEYLSQNIKDCQSTILQLEDDDNDIQSLDTDLDLLLAHSDAPEMKYLIEKVITMLINQNHQFNQLSEKCRQLESKYREVSDTSRIRDEILHLINPSIDRNFYNKRCTFILEPGEPDDFSSPVLMPPPSSVPAIKQKPTSNTTRMQLPTMPSSSERSFERRLSKTPLEINKEVSFMNTLF